MKVHADVNDVDISCCRFALVLVLLMSVLVEMVQVRPSIGVVAVGHRLGGVGTLVLLM